MKINRGSAVRDQELVLFQMEFASSPPILSQMDIVGGRLNWQRSIPATPDAIRENPIQSPESKNKNITPKSTRVRINGSDMITASL